MQKEIIIKELAEEITTAYFNGGDIKELIDGAKKKLKEGIENETKRK